MCFDGEAAAPDRRVEKGWNRDVAGRSAPAALSEAMGDNLRRRASTNALLSSKTARRQIADTLALGGLPGGVHPDEVVGGDGLRPFLPTQMARIVSPCGLAQWVGIVGEVDTRLSDAPISTSSWCQ